MSQYPLHCNAVNRNKEGPVGAGLHHVLHSRWQTTNSSPFQTLSQHHAHDLSVTRWARSTAPEIQNRGG